MRNISFMLTTAQVRARTKDVTRRTGWTALKPGDRLRAVVKGMGLKRGEKVESLGIIEVVKVDREPLIMMHIYPTYGLKECRREGFPEMEPTDFIAMFCKSHKGCTPHTVITRIEFKYVDEIQQKASK
jgi:hypothetical protein